MFHIKYRYIIISIILTLFLCSGCTQKRKKALAPPVSEWKIKAENSRGFSPTKKKSLFNLSQKKEGIVQNKKTSLPKQKVTLKMHNAEISAILRALARVVDYHIIISEKIKGRLSLNVEDMQWNLVFQNVLKMHGLSYVLSNRLVRIITDEDLTNELNRESLRLSLQKLEPMVTRVVHIAYANPDALCEDLQAFTKVEHSSGESNNKNIAESSMFVDSHTNSLIIQATGHEMKRLLDLIYILDKPTKQILIEANIIETNRNTARELGVQWGMTGGKTSALIDFPVVDGAFVGYLTTKGKDTLSGQLSALQEKGDLNILSNPSITTIDNKKAIIESGKEIPFQTIEDGETKTEYKKAVILLEVIPHVIDDNTIRLEIETNKDEIDLSVEVNGNPAIITKKAKTEVVLFNGQTTVIGGLNKDKSENNEKGVPLLMDIPYLGNLFKWSGKGQEMEELLIFITPTILKEYQ